MTVGEITKLLGGIASGLPDEAKKTRDGLLAFKDNMEPFEQVPIEGYVYFLKQCDEYNKTGIIPITVSETKPKSPPKSKKEGMTVGDAEINIRSLLTEIPQGVVATPRINALLEDINKGLNKTQWDELLKKLNFTGKAKTKGDAVERVRQMLNSQLEMYVKAQAFSDPR